MRKHGYIGDVHFVSQGFNIYSLSYEYKLVYNGASSMVCANNMTELKEEIAKLTGGYHGEQS